MLNLQFVYAEATTHSGIVICKATLEVSIHVPTAMTLNVRGGQIAVGRKLSVFPMGIKVNLGFLLCFCKFKLAIGCIEITYCYLID